MPDVAEPQPPSATCPKCGAVVEASEAFCPTCGGPLQNSDPAAVSIAAEIARKRLETSRKWIGAVAVLTLFGAVIMFFIQRRAVEEDIEKLERTFQNHTPEERDQAVRQSIGMGYDEAIAMERRRVIIGLVVDLGVSAVFFGLFVWAKKQPFAAALIALFLYLTVLVISGIIEPASIPRGLFIKLAVILALGNGVAAAFKLRKLQT